MVCTANVCRSPMGEGLLRARLAEIGADVTITSAGTREAGLPVDPNAVAALAPLGVDISSHRPRQLTRDLIETEGADLVITMTREHLRTVATMGRTLFHRTFTLPELVRRATAAGRDLPNDLRGWVEAVGDGRKPSQMMTPDPADDVADPYGEGAAAVRRTGEEIDRLVRALVLLAPWPRS